MILPQDITNSTYDDIFLLKVWSINDDSTILGKFSDDGQESKGLVNENDTYFEEALNMKFKPRILSHTPR